MKNIIIAVALAAALPAAAFAQAGAAPTSSPSMQGMDMNMSGMKMQKMSCKDMQAMMATNHQMHMSSADMKGMDGCGKGASAAGKTQPGTTPQR